MTRHTTDTPPREQPNPLLDQFPTLMAIRNRLADMKQDLAAVTGALTAHQGGIQTPENQQAVIRATEFMCWFDMAIQKAEIELQARELHAAMTGGVVESQAPEPGILPPLTPDGSPPEPEVPLT